MLESESVQGPICDVDIDESMAMILSRSVTQSQAASLDLATPLLRCHSIHPCNRLRIQKLLQSAGAVESSIATRLHTPMR